MRLTDEEFRTCRNLWNELAYLYLEERAMYLPCRTVLIKQDLDEIKRFKLLSDSRPENFPSARFFIFWLETDQDEEYSELVWLSPNFSNGEQSVLRELQDWCGDCVFWNNQLVKHYGMIILNSDSCEPFGTLSFEAETI